MSSEKHRVRRAGGFDLSRAIIVSSEKEKVRFFDFEKEYGAYYSRVGIRDAVVGAMTCSPVSVQKLDVIMRGQTGLSPLFSPDVGTP